MPEASSSDSRLGVVVLAYGGDRVHDPLLASLLVEGVDPRAVVLVHNQATRGEAPPRAPAGIEVLQTERNLGYAGGMNRGIAVQIERGVDGLLLLTHDARLRPGSLAAMVAASEADPTCGICGPVLLFTGTERPYSFGGETTETGANRHLTVRPSTEDGGLVRCDWVDGGTMLVQSDVFDAVGSFDERFWGYFEDADLCLRARRAGFGVAVALAAQADQDSGATKRRGPWAYLLARNGLAYARSFAGPRGLWAGLGRALLLTAINLARTAVRVTRLRPGDTDESWAIAVGTARGTVDYLRGRWGPPPSDLPGMGDLGNA